MGVLEEGEKAIRTQCHTTDNTPGANAAVRSGGERTGPEPDATAEDAPTDESWGDYS